MKTGFNKTFWKILIALQLLTHINFAFAVGATIATALLLTGIEAAVVAFAINMVVSAVITKTFFSPNQPGSDLDSQNPGNRVTLPPATDYKLPVVYGQAWLGGAVTDTSITSNNQTLFACISLCEVTGNGADTITFGNIYWGGKRVKFDPVDTTKVIALVDDSNNEEIDVTGLLYFYLYKNGSANPVNTNKTAIEIMQFNGLTYIWDDNKLMSNCAFAIVRIAFNPGKGLTGIAQTRFQITNSRSAPGDCFYDYLTNDVYGAAIPTAQVDTTSLTALNTYCAQSFSYTTSSGSTATQNRFRFDGVLETNQNVMDNLQNMAQSCNCLLRYNEVTSQWGVIVQQPTYTIAMALDDSNMVSSISISPLDSAGSYNYIECKFPNSQNKDSFDTVDFDLAQIDPSLLYQNEPVNKFSISLPLVNNSVRAQYIATRLLKSGREDLQVQVAVNFSGLQLEAGDIVTVTNANYGWTAKEFRVHKVTQEFSSDGVILAKLILTEFNPAVYDDTSITEFLPLPNTGLPIPLAFGAIPAPYLVAEYPTAATPYFVYQLTTPFAGVTQYGELWYSAYSSPTQDQLFFVGTTAIQPDGNPYENSSIGNSVILPYVEASMIPAGNWYFFARMVNSLGSSSYSPASILLEWRPQTYQFARQYVMVAYADDINGGGFSFSPTNKSYYGLYNVDAITLSTNPADYTWYLAEPTFGTEIFLVYANRTSRRFSFDSGFADFADTTGAFVPTQTTIFDPSIWSALPGNINYINLDVRTGQLLTTGTTSIGTGEIAVTNNPDGRVVASLKQYLDFGPGNYTKTSAVGTLTIDIYGRVVGFQTPDDFYFTKEIFTATSGQTVFSVTRGANYTINQCLVFQNGCLLDESEYTDTGGSTGTVTLTVGATLGDIVQIISVNAQNVTPAYYAPLTRNVTTLTNASAYTASGFTLNSGYELLFLNGTVMNEQDYDITGQTITNFPDITNGLLTVIQFVPNNLGTPAGTPVNILVNTIVGQSTYPFNYDPNAINIYANGVLYEQGVDFTTGTGVYYLGTAPTTSLTTLFQQTFARTGAV